MIPNSSVAGAPPDGHLAPQQLVAGIQRVEYGSLGEDPGVVGVRRALGNWRFLYGKSWEKTWESYGKIMGHILDIDMYIYIYTYIYIYRFYI